MLAVGLAVKRGSQLGLNVAEDLRAAFLDTVPVAAAQELKEKGAFILTASGVSVQVTEVTSAQQLARAPGAVLFLGADSERSMLLKSIPNGTCVAVVPRTQAELDELTSRFPEAGRAELTLEREPSLSESQLRRLEWFEERYTCIASGHFNPQSNEVRLGDRQPQVCRYCGKSCPEVSFANVSHAFPEQIGNKKLVDLLECDQCNAHFAVHVEDHFGKWSLPSRSMTRIKGKKNKIPTYQSGDEKFRVDAKAGQLNIALREGDERVEFDEDAKSIRMTFERQSYVPMAVFKCFVKMALAAMPEPEASECAHLKEWVLQKTHTYESFPFKPLMLYTQFIAGPLPNDKVSYTILRRKPGVSNCPYMMFVLSYANFVYQISLPMPRQDNLIGAEPVSMQVSYFPNPWDTPDHESSFGAARLLQEDLSSPEVKKGDKFPMSFAYEKAVQVGKGE